MGNGVSSMLTGYFDSALGLPVRTGASGTKDLESLDMIFVLRCAAQTVRAAGINSGSRCA